MVDAQRSEIDPGDTRHLTDGARVLAKVKLYLREGYSSSQAYALLTPEERDVLGAVFYEDHRRRLGE